VIDENAIRLRFAALDAVLDERGRRRFAAAEALSAGRGGVKMVSQVTGIARSTIGRGIAELRDETPGQGLQDRVRRAGAGRKSLTATDPKLLGELERLVEPVTRGDPIVPLRWTARSLRNLAADLQALGYRISHETVGKLLRQLGYSLQANRKTLEGASNPDRDAQFHYINDRVQEAMAAGQPAISVDTKKKELVGDFKNNGRDYRPKGDPEKVRVHDFKIPELGRASPYGVYDIADNAGWVSVGIDHDTASFAVNSIRRWWQTMGQARYPNARTLLITAACPGEGWGEPVRKFVCEAYLTRRSAYADQIEEDVRDRGGVAGGAEGVVGSFCERADECGGDFGGRGCVQEGADRACAGSGAEPSPWLCGGCGEAGWRG